MRWNSNKQARKMRRTKVNRARVSRTLFVCESGHLGGSLLLAMMRRFDLCRWYVPFGSNCQGRAWKSPFCRDKMSPDRRLKCRRWEAIPRPPCRGWRQAMARHLPRSLADREFPVQADQAGHVLTAAGGRHRVAVAPHLHVGIPAHYPGLDVTGVETMHRQRVQMRLLPGKTGSHHLAHGPLHPPVRFFDQPGLEQLVQVR